MSLEVDSEVLQRGIEQLERQLAELCASVKTEPPPLADGTMILYVDDETVPVGEVLEVVESDENRIKVRRLRSMT